MGSGVWFFDTVVDLYFLVDLVLNFFMSYTLSTGLMEGRHRMIVRRYLRGW
eukprot:COSAG01_NODE_6043_length_3882_cov_3.851042_7_plen_51_part_00